MDQVTPPFYQFSYVYIIQCQKWYRFDLYSMQWVYGDVAAHTAPCQADTLADVGEIQRQMKQVLANNGFDISTIP
jgi:hypothetical protein